MTTSILELGEYFDVRDMATKAREAASMFDGGEEVTPDERNVLLVLNAGLANFLTGEYKAEEPESGTIGTEAVSEWVEFAHDISYSYDHLSDIGYTTFHEQDNLASVLEEQAEDFGYLANLPAFLQNAINWTRVEEYVKSTGTLVEMSIDGEIYVSNVSL